MVEQWLATVVSSQSRELCRRKETTRDESSSPVPRTEMSSAGSSSGQMKSQDPTVDLNKIVFNLSRDTISSTTPEPGMMTMISRSTATVVSHQPGELCRKMEQTKGENSSPVPRTETSNAGSSSGQMNLIMTEEVEEVVEDMVEVMVELVEVVVELASIALVTTTATLEAEEEAGVG